PFNGNGVVVILNGLVRSRPTAPPCCQHDKFSPLPVRSQTHFFNGKTSSLVTNHGCCCTIPKKDTCISIAIVDNRREFFRRYQKNILIETSFHIPFGNRKSI